MDESLKKYLDNSKIPEVEQILFENIEKEEDEFDENKTRKKLKQAFLLGYEKCKNIEKESLRLQQELDITLQFLIENITFFPRLFLMLINKLFRLFLSFLNLCLRFIRFVILNIFQVINIPMRFFQFSTNLVFIIVLIKIFEFLILNPSILTKIISTGKTFLFTVK